MCDPGGRKSDHLLPIFSITILRARRPTCRSCEHLYEQKAAAGGNLTHESTLLFRKPKVSGGSLTVDAPSEL